MKKRICVLEDNEEILDIVRIILEDENYEVYGFGTVSQFISSFRMLEPALCLLDVMLPDGNGLEVCDSIKNSPDTSDIPVIVMTANTQIAKMRERSTADDFIAKPFDINDLAGRINQLVNRNNQAQTA
ncbi:response regulator transcription factor [Pedobacter sp. GR22-6]|uniref:response regulator transcription factor n=1 Tax=Pedobacter sp. GR22-6 TaxID=3127957 RepID=UPI00307DB20D